MVVGVWCLSFSRIQFRNTYLFRIPYNIYSSHNISDRHFESDHRDSLQCWRYRPVRGSRPTNIGCTRAKLVISGSLFWIHTYHRPLATCKPLGNTISLETQYVNENVS